MLRSYPMDTKVIAHNIGKKVRTNDIHITEHVDFAGLLLSGSVQNGLRTAGFKRPSPIQLKAIPLGRCGLDLIVQAKSGTGKTCVFTVIALENLVAESAATQVLVLAPTREIAIQITEVFHMIGSGIPNLKCAHFIGGTTLQQDVLKAKRCHVAVGTPGRIMQLIEQQILKTDSIRMFVLDEADKLLEESFQEQINWIYSTLPENKQILALSATYPEYLAEHLTHYMRNPMFVRLDSSNPALLGVQQYYHIVPFHPIPQKAFDNKLKALFELLSTVTFHQCLIFSNYQTRAQTLSEQLNARGWPTAYICGSQDQKQRTHILTQLKLLQCRILVSTDLTSRGIDAEYVNLVVNLDVPYDTDTYLHRVGRAGRFGSIGAAVSIATIGKEEGSIKNFMEICNTHVKKLPEPFPEDLVTATDGRYFSDKVSKIEVYKKHDDSGTMQHSNGEHITDLTTLHGSQSNEKPISDSKENVPPLLSNTLIENRNDFPSKSIVNVDAKPSLVADCSEPHASLNTIMEAVSSGIFKTMYMHEKQYFYQSDEVATSSDEPSQVHEGCTTCSGSGCIGRQRHKIGTSVKHLPFKTKLTSSKDCRDNWSDVQTDVHSISNGTRHLPANIASNTSDALGELPCSVFISNKKDASYVNNLSGSVNVGYSSPHPETPLLKIKAQTKVQQNSFQNIKDDLDVFITAFTEPVRNEVLLMLQGKEMYPNKYIHECKIQKNLDLVAPVAVRSKCSMCLHFQDNQLREIIHQKLLKSRCRQNGIQHCQNPDCETVESSESGLSSTTRSHVDIHTGNTHQTNSRKPCGQSTWLSHVSNGKTIQRNAKVVESMLSKPLIENSDAISHNIQTTHNQDIDVNRVAQPSAGSGISNEPCIASVTHKARFSDKKKEDSQSVGGCKSQQMQTKLDEKSVASETLVVSSQQLPDSIAVQKSFSRDHYKGDGNNKETSIATKKSENALYYRGQPAEHIEEYETSERSGDFFSDTETNSKTSSVTSSSETSDDEAFEACERKSATLHGPAKRWPSDTRKTNPVYSNTSKQCSYCHRVSACRQEENTTALCCYMKRVSDWYWNCNVSRRYAPYSYTSRDWLTGWYVSGALSNYYRNNGFYMYASRISKANDT
ncbi:PREDICTED: uncharacterized protein LOC106807357 [Priapulus caudatus]|uniref:RNA helicase n=1 Tax=Priapulus caudatus TaxID=37621 RepID=A0ABM1DYY3_PRICU|nr:PREDICTED: uncharacterized protein LOC106807357 [Priapulus caudatus]